MYITEFKNKKVSDYLKFSSGGRVLFLFNHGLGDVINFIPIVEELKIRYPRYLFRIGVHKNRNIQISDLIQPISDMDNIRQLIRYFTYVFKISYPEPVNTKLSKPYFCNEQEIGLDNFVWEPFKLNTNIKTKSIDSLVGVHFFGNTNQRNKTLNINLAKQIWEDIEQCGFVPFEIYNKFQSSSVVDFDVVNETNSLRFKNSTIQETIDVISNCSYFFGIDSGPLYLATSVLGPERCIGLEKNYSISKYFPCYLKTFPINNYTSKKFKILLNFLKNGGS